MRYNAPFGSADANAEFVNGNPATGRRGSIPPAEQMEFPQREIVNAILGSGQIPTNDDLTQLLKAIRFFGGNIKNGIDTGTKNKIVVTLDPAPNSYSKLFCLVQKMGTANDAAMKIDVNGMGEKDLKDLGGAALSSGALVGGGVFLLWYDGSQMRVLGGAASYTTVTGLTANGGTAIDVDGTGKVDLNIAKPAHDTNFQLTDSMNRRTSGGVTYKNTLGELIDWIETVITWLPAEDPLYIDAGSYKVRRASKTQLGVARRATSTEIANRASTGGAETVYVAPEDLPGDASGVGIGAIVRASGLYTANGLTFASLLGATITGEKFLTGAFIGGVSMGPCLPTSTLISAAVAAVSCWADERRSLFASSQTWKIRNFRIWQTSTMFGSGNVDFYVELEFIRTV